MVIGMPKDSLIVLISRNDRFVVPSGGDGARGGRHAAHIGDSGELGRGEEDFRAER